MRVQNIMFALPPAPRPMRRLAAKPDCIGCDAEDCPGPGPDAWCNDAKSGLAALRRRRGKNKPEPTHEQEGF